MTFGRDIGREEAQRAQRTERHRGIGTPSMRSPRSSTAIHGVNTTVNDLAAAGN